MDFTPGPQKKSWSSTSHQAQYLELKGNSEECAEKITYVLEKALLPFTTNGPQYSSPEEYLDNMEPSRHGNSTLWAVWCWS